MPKKDKKIKTIVHPEIIPRPSIQSTNVLKQYIYEISKYPVLNRDQEKTLFKKWQEDKDSKALKTLIQSNLRFVVKIASEYQRFGSKLIDLIQEGNIGLLKAINEFNPYKGVRLITYAVWWVRGAIQEYLMRQHSIVRIGTTPTQKKLFYRLRKENLGDSESMHIPKLISSELGVSKKEVESMRQRLLSPDMSFDPASSHLDQSDPTPLVDEQIGDEEEIKLLKAAVKKLKPKLNEKEIYILEKRLLNSPPQTLQEIGNQFGVTREFIRQIEVALIKKIKKQLTLKSR